MLVPDDLTALLQKRKYSRALEILVETCGRKVFGMAIAMLGNEARAEETTQDVFLKVWRALPLYDGRAAPSTWLYAIARNTCLSALRSEGLRRTISLEESPEPAEGETFSRDVELNQLLRRLPEVQRQAVTLFYLQERSVEEVGLLLDLPEGTVKSHLHRGRRALGDMMKETSCTATKRRS
jgi:RNA polymerase sigma-70 factor (ECF subfamily)